MEILRLCLTSIISAGAIFLIAKLMGHKQVAQLDFFDYISGITIGSIAAELAIDKEKFWGSIIALLIYCAVSVALSVMTNKFPRTRKFINGTPTILFSRGILYRKNLAKAKLDLSEFMLMCRECGYFDLREIEVAIFEHNGKLSILPKSQNRPLTPTDMNISVPRAHIGTEVIMDGRVMGENLERLSKDETWLLQRISAEGIESPRDVFLAIYHEAEDTLSIYQ